MNIFKKYIEKNSEKNMTDKKAKMCTKKNLVTESFIYVEPSVIDDKMCGKFINEDVATKTEKENENEFHAIFKKKNNTENVELKYNENGMANGKENKKFFPIETIQKKENEENIPLVNYDEIGVTEELKYDLKKKSILLPKENSEKLFFKKQLIKYKSKNLVLKETAKTHINKESKHEFTYGEFVQSMSIDKRKKKSNIHNETVSQTPPHSKKNVSRSASQKKISDSKFLYLIDQKSVKNTSIEKSEVNKEYKIKFKIPENGNYVCEMEEDKDEIIKNLLTKENGSFIAVKNFPIGYSFYINYKGKSVVVITVNHMMGEGYYIFGQTTIFKTLQKLVEYHCLNEITAFNLPKN